MSAPAVLAPILALLPLPQTTPVLPELADLTERWRGAMEECGVAALALVLVEGDEIVHRVTLGHRDPTRDAPVTNDTMFYIASATKPFVAFAIEQLVEQGEIELDAPVKRYLPRFRLADPELTEHLRVRDLLCHRYGLSSGPIVLLDAYTGEITEDRYYHFLEKVEAAGGVSYSNLHFTLAGRIIEAVSGKPWREYLAERLFRPAGMTHTTGYADWMYSQDDVALPALEVDGRMVPTTRKSDRTMHAAGGLGTSIDDFARWIRLQLGRGSVDGQRLLSAEHVEATWRLESEGHDSAEFGPAEGFGLGWQRGNYRGHLELRHGGGYVGSASYVCFLPELELGLAVLATGGAGAGQLAVLVSTDVHEHWLADDEARDLLPGLLARSRAERAKDERRRSAAASLEARPLALSRPLEAYAGVYHDEWLGTLTLEAREGRLHGHLGELALELETPAPDELRLSSSGPIDGVEGRFELEGEAVIALTLELFGPARFVR